MDPFNYNKYENINEDFYNRLINEMNEMKIDKKLLKKIFKKAKVLKYNMKKKTIKFTIYMIPFGASRPRFNFKTKRTFVPNASASYKVFKKFKKENFDDLIKELIIYTPCEIECKYYLPIPNTMSKDEKVLAEMGFIRPVSKPDWDNLGKTTDMFNSNLWLDDSLVVKASVEKFYSFKPRAEFKIKYLCSFDSNYNRKSIKNRKNFKNIKKELLYDEDLF